MAVNGTNSTYSPNEPEPVIFRERALFTEQVLAGVGYGILTAIFAQMLSHIVKIRKSKTLPPFLAFYSTVMWCLGTLFLASSLVTGIDLYIDDRNYPGGPLGYASVIFNKPGTMLGNAVFILQGWLADGLMVYRCLIFFGFNYWIVAFPALMLTGSFCMGTLLLTQLAQPDNNLWVRSSLNFALPYWSLSIALNCIVTVMIVSRLLYIRKQVKQTIGDEHSRDYISVVSMLIESAAMTTVCSLLFLIPYARGNAVSSIFQGLACEIQISAALLIVLRVAQGRAWSKRTAQSINGISTGMKFAPPSSNTRSSAKTRDDTYGSTTADFSEAGQNIRLELRDKSTATFSGSGIGKDGYGAA